jgi:hypothetical protein
MDPKELPAKMQEYLLLYEKINGKTATALWLINEPDKRYGDYAQDDLACTEIITDSKGRRVR